MVQSIYFFFGWAAFLAPPLKTIFLASVLTFLANYTNKKFDSIHSTIISTCLLRTMVLNLSKSLRVALLVLMAIFLAVEVSAHFFWRPKSSIAFLRFPYLGFLMIGSLNLVKAILLIGMSCLSTPRPGPSTKT